MALKDLFKRKKKTTSEELSSSTITSPSSKPIPPEERKQSTLLTPTPPATPLTTKKSSGGYSYVDTSTGVGYEVTEKGEKYVVPSATTQEKISSYSTQQKELYQNVITQSAQETARKQGTNWNKLTTFEKNKLLRESYNKYAPQYKERVKRFAENLYYNEEKPQQTTDKKESKFVKKLNALIEKRQEKKEQRKEYTYINELGQTEIRSGSVPVVVHGYSEQGIRQQNINVLKVLFLGATSVPYSKAFNPNTYILSKGTQRTTGGITETQTKFFTSTGRRGATTSEFTKLKGLNSFTGETGGLFYKQGIKFPTAKFTTKFSNRFYAKEVLINVKQSGSATFQVSAGKIYKYYPMGNDIAKGLKSRNLINVRKGYIFKTDMQRFAGYGFGFRIRNKIYYLSRTNLEGKNIYSLGSLKITSRERLITLSMGKRGASTFGGRVFQFKPQVQTSKDLLPLTPINLESRAISTSSFLKTGGSMVVTNKQFLPLVSAQPPTTKITYYTPQLNVQSPLQIPKVNSVGKQTSSLISKQIPAPVQVPRQITTPVVIPKTPTKLAQVPLVTTKLSPPIFSSVTPAPFLFPFNIKPSKESSSGLFGVSIRRFGKFKSIGSNLSLQQAVNLGVTKTTTTLGATFKITGRGKKRLRTPFGYYQKGELFIEKPKYRLSTTGEIGEIQMFKKLKGGLKI